MARRGSRDRRARPRREGERGARCERQHAADLSAPAPVLDYQPIPALGAPRWWPSRSTSSVETPTERITRGAVSIESRATAAPTTQDLPPGRAGRPSHARRPPLDDRVGSAVTTMKAVTRADSADRGDGAVLMLGSCSLAGERRDDRMRSEGTTAAAPTELLADLELTTIEASVSAARCQGRPQPARRGRTACSSRSLRPTCSPTPGAAREGHRAEERPACASVLPTSAAERVRRVRWSWSGRGGNRRRSSAPRSVRQIRARRILPAEQGAGNAAKGQPGTDAAADEDVPPSSRLIRVASAKAATLVRRRAPR